MWNAEEHSDEDNQRWCYLRAIEWAALPAFLSQLIAPALFIIVSWKPILAGIIGAQLLWSLVRYRSVSSRFAYVSTAFVSVSKWLVALPSGVYLLANGHRLPAALAITWPFLVGVLGAFPPVAVGRLQTLFMAELGYVPKRSFQTLGEHH